MRGPYIIQGKSVDRKTNKNVTIFLFQFLSVINFHQPRWHVFRRIPAQICQDAWKRTRLLGVQSMILYFL